MLLFEMLSAGGLPFPAERDATAQVGSTDPDPDPDPDPDLTLALALIP